MAMFLDVQPTVENRWRALVLFGRNVATYKFALARALLQLRDRGNEVIPLEDLALPYALGICEHLNVAGKQGTSASSRFLEACRAFNDEKLTREQLREATVRLGFNNVIDAFHRLGPADLEHRFFIDERANSRGIRVTDEFSQLCEGREPISLTLENEARWRLVESAWELGVNRSLIEFDTADESLIVRRRDGRIALTSCRPALNGYQKGRCFYCFGAIGLDGGSGTADVDHFLPWTLRGSVAANLNGVWNLVLACPACNRGPGGKFDLVPSPALLERLHRRNEFLISSHHPLRETLMAQTGAAILDRVGYLQDRYTEAVEARIGVWTPPQSEAPAF